MVRLSLILILLVVLFMALRVLLGKRKLTLRQFMLIYAGVVVGALLIYLGLTGRLQWPFAVLGAVLPFLSRIFPWIMRSLGLMNFIRSLRAATSGPQSGNTASPRQGQQSTITTLFFAMTLDHDTGQIDGEILTGARQGQQLSTLDLSALLLLLDECQHDADSVNVLTAYLDRHHPAWQDEATATTAAPGTDMNPARAYEILGLAEGADRDEVIAAHRRLMQKFHPDRGGPTYLAAQINQAKDFLMERL